MTLLALAACLTAEPPASTGCGGCHGSASDPAPPEGLGGVVDPQSWHVGAHPTHGHGTDRSPATACNECHDVPGSVDAPGHLDDTPQAEVTWANGTLAAKDGRATGYDAEAHSCTVYCHGTEPIGWTDFGLGCDSCHGDPPATADHVGLPAGASCQGAGCHVALDPEHHVNGEVDTVPAPAPDGCGGACHGTEDSPAPPPDTAGNVDPSSPGVGAHAAHLGSALAPVPCDTCHEIYTSVSAPGHTADADTDVRFDGVATARGYAAAYAKASQTCADTACHGGPGAARPTPTWTDTAPMGCGDCHGDPPPTESHRGATSGACEAAGCHTAREPGTHVDGVVQFDDTPKAQACGGTCHGTAASPAPPPDTFGNTDPASPGVGAHAVHLAGGGGVPVPCDTCHVVPSAVGDPGHTTDGPGDVVFSGLATLGGAQPTYDPGTQTCSGAYCHTAGGASPAVTWTGGPLGCDACHGNPPPSPHPPSAACGACHPHAGADAVLHVDGIVE